MSESKFDITKARNCYAKGIDYCVTSIGRKWTLVDCFGNFPLFDTKRDAYEMASNVVIMDK